MARKKSGSSKWISRAIKKPGALRATAKRMGLLKGEGDKLSESDLQKLRSHAQRTGNTTLLRRVNLAKTLRKLSGRRKRGR